MLGGYPGEACFFLTDGGGVNPGDNRWRGRNWEKESDVGCPPVYMYCFCQIMNKAILKNGLAE